jgi:hypothetical protein
MSVHSATFSGMMDSTEADNFRRIQLVADVDRARDMVARYREGIDYYRRQIDQFRYLLGRVEERLNVPEEGRPR